MFILVRDAWVGMARRANADQFRFVCLVWLFVLFVCLFVCLSVYLFVCLFVCLFIGWFIRWFIGWFIHWLVGWSAGWRRWLAGFVWFAKTFLLAFLRL